MIGHYKFLGAGLSLFIRTSLHLPFQGKVTLNPLCGSLYLRNTTGEHLLVKIFSVTKFGKIFKKIFATTSSIDCGGFSRCFI
jgi:hypothetical protein